MVDFLPDLWAVFEDDVPELVAPCGLSSKLTPAWSPELELWLLVKEEDFVVPLLLVLESVSLLELVLAVLALLLFEELFTTPLLLSFSLSLSLSFSLKNLNLSSMEFLLLEGSLEEVLLLAEDDELAESELILFECLSARFSLPKLGVLRPVDVGNAEYETVGVECRVPLPFEICALSGISDGDPE